MVTNQSSLLDSLRFRTLVHEKQIKGQSARGLCCQFTKLMLIWITQLSRLLCMHEWLDNCDCLVSVFIRPWETTSIGWSLSLYSHLVGEYGSTKYCTYLSLGCASCSGRPTKVGKIPVFRAKSCAASFQSHKAWSRNLWEEFWYPDLERSSSTQTIHERILLFGFDFPYCV